MKSAFALLLAVGTLAAQDQLTVAQAVERALRNYPSIQISQEQLSAAAAGIRLARTAYLPRVDILAQANRGTRNNVFGQLLPQVPVSVIPSLSGPVIGSNNFGSAFGSALGGLITWEPFDFGLREANVAGADASRARAAATVKRTEFEVASAAADACLTLVAAQETVRAAQAGVDRALETGKAISAQVNAQLRPGADASRAEAEVAAARTQLIQAQQAVEIARATLAGLIGIEPREVAMAPGRLLSPPPEQPQQTPDVASNPIALEQNAAIEETRAQLHALERSWFPRFYLEGAVYARGTGAETSGAILGGVNGLAPTVQNWALGLTLSFPATDRPALREKEAIAAANMRAEQARARQIATDLRTAWNTAVAAVQGARAASANTPTEVESARTTLQQAGARYQSGLGNIEAVAEAQRLVTQAEIDDALARLSVWRGLLGLARAAGDLEPFIAEVSQTGVGR
jgi:outer membrane protein TolC